MRKKFIVLAMLLLCQDAAAQIRLVPFIDCTAQDGVYLSIKNTGTKVESIKESQLPWLPSSSLIQLNPLTRKCGKFEKLTADYMIWDTFGDSDITLAPGQIMHGFLSFNRVVSDFDSRRQDGEILIFLSSRRPLLPTQGVILVPKGRFFGKDQCPAYASLPNR
jgi:hypothetical protein